jgi:hypothetical protein
MLRASASFNAACLLLVAAAGADVCLGQTPGPDKTAKVIEQYGRVSSWGDNGQRPLFIGDAVKPQQMIVTGPDGYAKFRLADGSTFEVFQNSRMVFRQHAGSWSDLLDVLLGRVKVVIQKLNGAPNPNRVSSPTAIISVRGTVFDVVVEDDDGTTFVSVDEGAVDVRNMTAAGDPVRLQPGDSVRVIKNQPLAARKVDKGAVAARALKAAEDALAQVLLGRRTSGGPIPTAGGGGGAGPTVPSTGNGDTGKGGDSGGSTPGPTAPGAPGPPQ